MSDQEEVLAAEQKANEALAVLGLHLRRWQPTRCGYGNGGCGFSAGAHEGPGLVPKHEYQPVPHGRELYVLEALPE